MVDIYETYWIPQERLPEQGGHKHYRLYRLSILSYPITGDGAGQACDRIYITDAKLAKCGYTPHVGDEVNVTYNKFGKVAAILPVGE